MNKTFWKMVAGFAAWFILVCAMLFSTVGCASFKLGGAAYCPYGQSCGFEVSPPTTQPAARKVVGTLGSGMWGIEL